MILGVIVDWLYSSNTHSDLARREEERCLRELEAEKIAEAQNRKQKQQQRQKFEAIGWKLYDRPFLGPR